MNILARIERIYTGSGRAFLHGDLLSHLHAGYVFVTPQAALMGFRCRSSDVIAARDCGGNLQPWQAEEDGDCWFVWLAVGDIADLIRFIPRPAKFVAFSRRNVIKCYRFEEITRLAKCAHRFKSGPSPLMC